MKTTTILIVIAFNDCEWHKVLKRSSTLDVPACLYASPNLFSLHAHTYTGCKLQLFQSFSLPKKPTIIEVVS